MIYINSINSLYKDLITINNFNNNNIYKLNQKNFKSFFVKSIFK